MRRRRGDIPAVRALTLPQQLVLQQLAAKGVLYQERCGWAAPGQLTGGYASGTVNALQKRGLVHVAVVRMGGAVKARARLTDVGKAFARAVVVAREEAS